MKRKHMILFAAVLILDQVTKFAAASLLSIQQRLTIIPGFFHLTYMENRGAAWSMLEGKMWFFYIVTVVALIAMILFYRNQDRSNVLVQTALVLMMAGTVGNFIDRLCFQYVRDFLDFILLGYDFPVFNIADSALCIGVFLIIADVFLENKRVMTGK